MTILALSSFFTSKLFIISCISLAVLAFILIYPFRQKKKSRAELTYDLDKLQIRIQKLSEAIEQHQKLILEIQERGVVDQGTVQAELRHKARINEINSDRALLKELLRQERAIQESLRTCRE